ncbi:hypothetical protein E0L17_03690 [Olsenella sp. SW781]|uniref:PP2C family protein-serine/threonine phosphatase n=1 Tax=Olsenella sp. SW781 TaxID=2530046 RepID=UPI00143B0DA3|nr:protein phosphatase 2C domain-containing protein [Olsenella sp. SW781]NJE80425.1 hypothetical protein [Olsenella sp. SW781]
MEDVGSGRAVSEEKRLAQGDFYEISDVLLEPDEGDWANEPVGIAKMPGEGDAPEGIERLVLSLAGASDQGGRLCNEDSFMTHGEVGVISDGIGGAPYGDLFSRLCCQAFLDDWKEAVAAASRRGSKRDGESLMRSTFGSVDRFVSRASRYLGKGSGATLISAARWGDGLLIGSVGDTAAFCLGRDGRLVRIMADDGRAEGGGNALREAMGYRLIEHDANRVQIALLPLSASQRVLLCSDGVWTQLPENRVAEILSESDDPYTAAFRLVHEAAAACGPSSDNATAIVIHTGTPSRDETTPWFPS